MKTSRTQNSQQAEFDDFADLARLPEQLELSCKSCDHVADYDVRAMIIDTGADFPTAAFRLEKYVSFTAYLRCTNCRASGQWQFTDQTRKLLVAKIIQLMLDPKPPAGIQFAKAVLFDGSVCKDLAQGEDYLRSLIAADPADFYLYSRLANLLVKADLPELAEVEYRNALALNPEDSESWFDLGRLFEADGKREEAIHAYQQMLRFANHTDHVERDLLRRMVRNTLDRLFGLHDPAKHKLDFLPASKPRAELQGADTKTVVVHLLEINLRTEKGWQRLVDSYAPDTCPESPVQNEFRIPNPKFLQNQLVNGPREEQEFATTLVRSEKRIGRNDPCPCGSGKKPKRCCGRS